MNKIPLPTISEFLSEEFMLPMNLSTYNLSQNTGISIDEIQKILNDETEITPELSQKLAKFFGVSDMLFYNIQNDLLIRNNARELQYA